MISALSSNLSRVSLPSFPGIKPLKPNLMRVLAIFFCHRVAFWGEGFPTSVTHKGGERMVLRRVAIICLNLASVHTLIFRAQLQIGIGNRLLKRNYRGNRLLKRNYPSSWLQSTIHRSFMALWQSRSSTNPSKFRRIFVDLGPLLENLNDDCVTRCTRTDHFR